MSNGYEFFALSESRKRCLNGEYAIFAEGGFDGFWIRALGQEELAVVLPVDGFRVALLLVFGVDLNRNETMFFFFQKNSLFNDKYFSKFG